MKDNISPEKKKEIDDVAATLKSSGLCASLSDAYEKAREIVLGPQREPDKTMVKLDNEKPAEDEFNIEEEIEMIDKDLEEIDEDVAKGKETLAEIEEDLEEIDSQLQEPQQQETTQASEETFSTDANDLVEPINDYETPEQKAPPLPRQKLDPDAEDYDVTKDNRTVQELLASEQIPVIDEVSSDESEEVDMGDEDQNEVEQREAEVVASSEEADTEEIEEIATEEELEIADEESEVEIKDEDNEDTEEPSEEESDQEETVEPSETDETEVDSAAKQGEEGDFEELIEDPEVPTKDEYDDDYAESTKQMDPPPKPHEEEKIDDTPRAGLTPEQKKMTDLGNIFNFGKR